jgi:MerR family copper efflux transcriptional regulator
MLNLQPGLKVKGLAMRIGELARRANLSASRIRFYEAHGLLPKADRSGNGYRDYAEGTLETLQLIDGAQDLGFSLSEIRAALAQAGGAMPAKRDMLDALKRKLTSLDRHIEEVRLRRQRIVDLIEKIEQEILAQNRAPRRKRA